MQCRCETLLQNACVPRCIVHPLNQVTPKRLKFVAEFLFPDRKWREAIAQYLKVDETTVLRWEKEDRVPYMAAIALEMTFDYGLIKEGALARE